MLASPPHPNPHPRPHTPTLTLTLTLPSPQLFHPPFIHPLPFPAFHLILTPTLKLPRLAFPLHPLPSSSLPHPSSPLSRFSPLLRRLVSSLPRPSFLLFRRAQTSRRAWSSPSPSFRLLLGSPSYLHTQKPAFPRTPRLRDDPKVYLHPVHINLSLLRRGRQIVYIKRTRKCCLRPRFRIPEKEGSKNKSEVRCVWCLDRDFN